MSVILVTAIYLSTSFHPNNTFWARKLERKIGHKVRVVRSVSDNDPYLNLNTLDKWASKYGYIKTYIKTKYPDNTVKLVFMPALTDAKGVTYFAGAAQRCDPIGGVATVYGNPRNSYGENRALNLAITAGHEVGHVLGAPHDDKKYADGYSMMFSLAGWQGYARRAMDYSRSSVKAIKNCLSMVYGGR